MKTATDRAVLRRFHTDFSGSKEELSDFNLRFVNAA